MASWGGERWATLRERLRDWARSSDLDLLFGTYPYFIPKKLIREKIRGPAATASGMLIDVGCGYQPYRFLFGHVRRYVGLDADGRRKPHVIGSAERLPFGDGVADVVLCTEVLEHCPHPGVVMNELARILRPGGTLLLTTPMSWNLHYEPHDYFRFTRYGLQVMLTETNLQLVKVERIGGVFAMTGARITEVVCKTTARALKVIPAPVRLFMVRTLYLCLTIGFLAAAKLIDWVDQTDAIGWMLIGRKPPEAVGAA